MESKKKLYENSFLRHFIVGFVLFLVLIGLTIFSDYGLVNRIKLQNRRANLVEELKTYAKISDSLQNDMKMLSFDSLTIEQVAREKYGLVKPGERVYFIEEDTLIEKK